MVSIGIIITGHPNPYHCIGKDFNPNNNTGSTDMFLNQSVPFEVNAYNALVPSTCVQYTNYSLYGRNQTEPCTAWHIDPDGYNPDRGTMLMEVCFYVHYKHCA